MWHVFSFGRQGKTGVAKRSLHLRTLLIIIIIIIIIIVIIIVIFIFIFNIIVIIVSIFIIIIIIIIISFKQGVEASLSKVASQVQLCTALILNGSMD